MGPEVFPVYEYGWLEKYADLRIGNKGNPGSTPEFLGQGSKHTVWLTRFANGNGPDIKRVIKIPIRLPFVSPPDPDAERRNISTVARYFKGWAAASEVRQHGDSFCVITDFVEGVPLSQREVLYNPVLRSQFQFMVMRNRRLWFKKEQMIDFVGVPGWKTLLRGEAIVNNVIVKSNPTGFRRLALIDHDLFGPNEGRGSDRLGSGFSIGVNWGLLILAFGTNLFDPKPNRRQK